MDWTTKEVEVIVNDYFDMLAKELDGLNYNKSEHRQKLLHLLPGRTEGSIEFKHANISEVIAKAGLPYIKGYKPRSHFQQLLVDEVGKYLNKNLISFESKFEKFVNVEVPQLSVFPDFDNLIEDPPARSILEDEEINFNAVKINYLEREQNNRSLGEKGEEFIVQYEKWMLLKAGKPNLADKIEWVSKIEGDGKGFDILSRNLDGTDKYLEVKTTKLTKETPIYLTKREIEFANKRKSNFHLYRLFSFGSKTRMFTRIGNYESFCKILPTSFKGIF